MAAVVDARSAATTRTEGAGSAGACASRPAFGISTQRYSPLSQVCTTGKYIGPSGRSSERRAEKTNSSNSSAGSRLPDQAISVTPSDSEPCTKG